MTFAEAQLLGCLGAFILANLSRTYLILLIAALVNALLNLVSSSQDLAWFLWCATLDTCTALAILRYGGVHKRVQLPLLIIAIIINILMEVDLQHNTSLVYDWYLEGLMIVTSLQLLGSGFVPNGLFTNLVARIPRAWGNGSKSSSLNLEDH